MAVVSSTKIGFDICDPLPLKGFPEGKYRIKMRPEDFTYVHVRTEDGMRAYTVKEEDGFWVPLHEVARNLRGEIER